MTDERPQVRATAVLGIGALARSALALPPGLAGWPAAALRRWCGDELRGPLDAAAWSRLPRGGQGSAASPLPRRGRRAGALELVARWASEVVADVALLDGDAAVRVEGVKQLGALGAVEPIAERALRDPDVRVRSAAVAALGELRQPAALTALALRDASAEVRILAVRWLGELGDEPALLEALRDATPPMRIAALDAFAARKTAEPLLAAVASDAAPVAPMPSAGCRRSARRARRWRRSTIRSVGACRRARGARGGRAVQPRRGSPIRGCGRKPSLCSAPSAAALAAALGDVGADVRVAAVEWLGRLRAAPPLLRALADPHPSVRLAAVQAAAAAAASAAAHVVDDTRDALYQHGSVVPTAPCASPPRGLHRLGDPSWSGVIAGDSADAQRLGGRAPSGSSVLLG